MPLSSKIKLLYPRLLAIILLFASCSPTMIFGLDNFFPAVDLICIYYWCIYRPETMPNWFVFTLGIFRDILFGLPLGLNALSNLSMRLIVFYNGEKVKNSFTNLWQGFAILTTIILVLKWLSFSFLLNHWINLNTILTQTLLTILIYPFFHNLFNIIYSILPRKSRLNA